MIGERISCFRNNAEKIYSPLNISIRSPALLRLHAVTHFLSHGRALRDSAIDKMAFGGRHSSSICTNLPATGSQKVFHGSMAPFLRQSANLRIPEPVDS